MDDYGEYVRSLEPDRPIAEDAIDRHLLKTDPAIKTAVNLHLARLARRARLDLDLTGAIYLRDAMDRPEDDGYDPEKWSEPIPY